MATVDEKFPPLSSTKTTASEDYEASLATTLVSPTYSYKTLIITNIAIISYPFSSNVDTSILDSSRELLYTSRKLCGTSILFSPQNPQIAKTTYTLLHSPVISFSPSETCTYSQEDIKFECKGMFTRAQTFATLDKEGNKLSWEWSYKGTLVLTREDVGEVARVEKKWCEKEARVLIREGVDGVGEVLVIVTALVMLKKEADRKAMAIGIVPV